MRLISIFLSVAMALPAIAEPVDTKTAKSMLFSTRGVEVNVLEHDFLTEKDRTILTEIGKSQPYYGVIAMSPDQGLLANTTLAAAQYHGVEPARVAALKACNAKREKGTADCEIVAEILPKKWSEQPLQLSVEATEAFNKKFRRKKGPKAFAVSVETGQWAFALGQGALETAMQDCAGKAAKMGAEDCTIAIAD